MKKKVLVGLSWPYANGRLHIGHVASSLPADVIARYHRSIGNDVSFITGSDCFGTPILVQAIAEKVTPESLAEKYHKLLEKDFRALGFSFDNYSKTMSKQHQEFVQQFHRELYAGEYIYEKTAPQLYCEKCKKYLPDRYVEGICPHCKKEAKGDSCDHCGKILEPEDLISPKCKLCGSKPVGRDTTQMYLKLSALQSQIQQFFDKRKERWTANAQGLTQRYLNEGLHDRAITRSIEWGVPVPKKGWEEKRIYIWAENVLGYLSASSTEFIKEASGLCGNSHAASGTGATPLRHLAQTVLDAGKTSLMNSANGALLHYYVHAKDNIPFHSIILPGLIMARNASVKMTGVQGVTPWYHLPDIIVASEYITLEGQKISKSKGNVLTAEELINEFDADMIRYYFLRTTNSQKDSNFTFEEFVNVINGELVNNFGNLVNRTLSFIKTKFDGVIPKKKTAQKVPESYRELMLQGNVNKALDIAMELVNHGNKYFAEHKPWENNDKKVIAEVVDIIKCATDMLEPFIPSACAKVKNWLSGNKLPEIEILFKRLDMKDVKEKFVRYMK